MEAVSTRFVFLEGSCLSQSDVIEVLERAVGYQITKVQAFKAVQKIGKINKEVTRIGTRENGIDKRQRMYPLQQL